MKKFTLIELLVVVTVIAILAALLLPTLSRAKYRANKVVCVNNQRQLAMGLIVYATDYDDYYPSKGVPRSNGSPWEQAMTNINIGGGDLRPLIRPYWGGTKTDIEQCPLAPEVQHDQQLSYMLYFNMIHTDPHGSIYSKHMERINDTFKPKINEDLEINVLVSDVAVHYGGHPQKQRYTNHHEFIDVYDEHDHWYLKFAYRSPTNVYPLIDANFGGQDGSIRNFQVFPDDNSGFVRAGTQLVPESFAE